MSIVSGKPKHLFVVKDGRSGPGGRTVSAEQFTPEQRAAVDRVLGLVPRPPGVLVGAHFMDALWDVRPLVLEKGVMTLTRFSDPGLEEARREALARAHGALSGVAGIIACGQIKGPGGPQLWMRRRFFTATLGENASTEALSSMHPIHLARRLIGYVRYLEGLGIVHGHIAPSNVTVEGDTPILLDYGFAGWGSVAARYRDLAPEISRGEAPSPATDVFGLALVMRSLAATHVSAEQLRFLESMAAENAGDRPVIGAVEAFFSGHPPPPVGPTTRDIAPSPRVGAGRLVTPATPPAPGPRESSLLRVDPPIERVVPPASAPNSSPAASKPGPPRASDEAVRLDPSKVVEKTGSGMPIILFVGSLAILVALLFRFNVVQWGGGAAGPSIPYPVYWGSAQPQMMRQVAEAALVDGDPAAEVVIVTDALRGGSESSALVRAGLLRVGYNPLWQHELEEVDRETLLGLALLKIAPEHAPKSLDLSALHPGVVVALAGDVDLQRRFPELEGYPLVEVAQLPAPFGPVFLELIKQKIEFLGDPAARAASHLLAGNLGRDVFRTFFPEDISEENLISRVKVIVGLLSKLPGGERALLAAIGDDGRLGELLGWFKEDELVGWGKVAVRDRLGVLVGLPTTTNLSLEQLADLLRFPIEPVRRSARERLRDQVREGTALILDYLARADAALSREQAVALVAALEVQGDTAPAFVQGWFATEPSSKAVVELLIARSAITEIDGFNVEGARFLKTHQWEFSLDQIEALARHSEPLVRALAYARLDPRDTAQRSVLEKAAAAETSPKLKEQVLAKLRIS